MLGSIIWNTGALGSVAAWNPITWSFSVASLMTSTIRDGVLRDPGFHTPSEILTAALMPAFGADFYNRFHITTLVLDLGNLVSDQTTTVTVWNAFLRSWILDDLFLTNAEGLTISGQPAPPLQYNPLQERTWTLGISTDGPAAIDAQITWSFSNGDDVVLSVVGQRIVPWNWQPDWSQPVLESVEWMTDVIQAFRGEEQRRALRIDPRQFLEFQVTASEDERRYMEAVLWGWGSRAFALPLWFDGQNLVATLNAGATVIPLNPAQRGYEAGDLVIITDGNSRNYEAVEILSLASTITLKRPTLQTWPAGTRVYPARSAVIENLVTVDRFDGTVGTLRIQWRMTEPKAWAAAATPTYRSLPVFEQKPNWIENPTLAFERKVSVLDASTGLTENFDEAAMPLTSQRMRYTLVNRAELDAWKKRLWTLRGKQGSIWVPTWARDMKIAATIGSASLAIDVNWFGYTKQIAQDSNRRDVRIELRNGTIFYRRITGSVEVSTAVERLSIDSALGINVQPEDAVLVSFMGLSRSEADRHEFAYFTGDVTDTVFTAKGFRNEL